MEPPNSTTSTGSKLSSDPVFSTSTPLKKARGQLEELKQIKSGKAYSSIFRTVALSMTDLTPAESLDRYLRGFKKHVRAQVLLQKPRKTEEVMQLAEIYDPLVFGFSDKKHYKKHEQSSHELHTLLAMP